MNTIYATFSAPELTARRAAVIDERARLINGHGNPCACSQMCRRRAALDRVLDEVRTEEVLRIRKRVGIAAS